MGVLEPTNTPIDRVVWIPIDGYFYMEGHAPVNRETGRMIRIDKSKPLEDKYKEVSAVMLKLRRPADGMMMRNQFNLQGNKRTFAWPLGAVMADLFNKIAFFLS